MSPELRFKTDAPVKLIKPKELVIIQHILDLDLRGFVPKLSAIQDMAN